MTNQIGIYDHSTGKNTVREMTSAEIEAYAKEATERAAVKANALAEKETTKTALLTSLGITEAQAITFGLLAAPSVPIPAEQSTPNLPGNVDKL
jgi:hypothetical protein